MSRAVAWSLISRHKPNIVGLQTQCINKLTTMQPEHGGLNPGHDYSILWSDMIQTCGQKRNTSESSGYQNSPDKGNHGEMVRLKATVTSLLKTIQINAPANLPTSEHGKPSPIQSNPDD